MAEPNIESASIAELIEAEGQADLGPSAAVRRRVEQGFRQRIDAGGGGGANDSGGSPATEQSPLPPSSARWSTQILAGSSFLALAIGIGVGIGASPLLLDDAPPMQSPLIEIRKAAPTPPAIVSPAAASPDSVLEVPVDALDSVPPIPAETPRRRARRRTPVVTNPVITNSASTEPVPNELMAPTEVIAPSGLAEERALIDRARSALAAGRPHDALLALMRHQRRFPEGAMAEERERLMVSSLNAQGRHELARQREARSGQ